MEGGYIDIEVTSIADALSNRFCDDCKYRCKETAQQIKIKRDKVTSITTTNAMIKTQLDNYERGDEQYRQQFVLMCHTAGKQYQARHPEQKDIQKIQPKSMYMSHIASSSDIHAAPVCLHCFRSMYQISESNWRKVCPSLDNNGARNIELTKSGHDALLRPLIEKIDIHKRQIELAETEEEKDYFRYGLEELEDEHLTLATKMMEKLKEKERAD